MDKEAEAALRNHGDQEDQTEEAPASFKQRLLRN